MSTPVQSVDDTDISESSVSYSGSWTASQLNLPSVYHGTIHSTTERDASATFTFATNAVGVMLVVPACSGNVVGSWTIDGQTGKVGIPCTSDIQTNYPFYPYSACSSFGPHTMVVRNAGTVPFQLDRFIFGNITSNAPSSNTPVAPPVTSPGTTTTSGTTTSSISTAATTSSHAGTSTLPMSQGASPSSNSTVATGVATALNAGTASASTLEYTATGVSSSGVLTSTGVSNDTTSSSSLSLPLGPIIGGSLGAFALILLFIFLLIKCRPWKRGKSNQVETVPSSTPTPFNVQERLVGQVGSDDKTALAAISTATPKNGPLDPASLSTPTPENRQSLAPSYSDPIRRTFQSAFTNVSANRASALTDVPPAYDSLNRSSETQPIL